jgi:predicted RNA binding protein YcfA (HicA-like mRNA interferase family)
MSVKSLSGEQLAKLLEQQGWNLLRVHGSHHIYGKAGSPVRLSVPIHGNRPMKIGLLKHLLKMAGLPKDIPE